MCLKTVGLRSFCLFDKAKLVCLEYFDILISSIKFIFFSVQQVVLTCITSCVALTPLS